MLIVPKIPFYKCVIRAFELVLIVLTSQKTIKLQLLASGCHCTPKL